MTGRLKVWVTRARPGAERTAERLAAAGFTPIVAPLLNIVPLTPALPVVNHFDGLVFTSANGVAAFVALAGAEATLDHPVFAVGAATARAATQAGFRTVVSADGDARDLAVLIRRRGAGPRLLAPGADRPAADLSALVGGAAEVAPLIVYRAEPTAAPAPEAFDAVLIHSPRAAQALATRLALQNAGACAAVAISPAAAEPLFSLGFATLFVAERPDEPAMFAALKAALGKPPADV
ncbi:uroporphyrinogen-III synthase [Brevundimonas sp. VNH65]|uniref:uroporphyrinogen-III synthase n=1 Tax=Brevundimonas sp. VNH65 TaxID=3400917 RepID=UPI003BFB0534